MAKRICGIYAIENLITGKVYIGGGTRINQRWRIHKNTLKRNQHYNSYLQEDWNEYGEENFQFIVIELCEKNELDKKEDWYIKKYENKYNLQGGGKVGYIRSEESKKKISGDNHPLWGKHHTPETRKKMSEAKKGHIVTPETRQKISEANKCHIITPETRQKMSEAKKGRKCYLFGKKWSEESIRKREETKRRKRNAKRLKNTMQESLPIASGDYPRMVQTKLF